MRTFESETLSDAILSTSPAPAGALERLATVAQDADATVTEAAHSEELAVSHPADVRGPAETHALSKGQMGWSRAAEAANEVSMPDFRGDDLVAFVCAVAGAECSLTPMELEVARMRLLGWQRQAIAAHMGRSTHTIDSHLKAVRRKLGSGSATALFKAAVETLNRRAQQASARELD